MDEESVVVADNEVGGLVEFVVVAVVAVVAVAVIVADVAGCVVELVVAKHEGRVGPEGPSASSMLSSRRQGRLLGFPMCRQVVGWMLVSLA